jgi:hypothetical protein
MAQLVATRDGMATALTAPRARKFDVHEKFNSK